MAAIHMILDIDPGKLSTAQQRRFATRGGHIMTYLPDTVKRSRTAYETALRPHLPQEKMTGPLALEVTFIYTTKARKEGYKTTRPDIDNCMKLLQDVMTHMGFYEDDSQIADLHAVKKWGTEPRIEIALQQI